MLCWWQFGGWTSTPHKCTPQPIVVWSTHFSLYFYEFANVNRKYVLQRIFIRQKRKLCGVFFFLLPNIWIFFSIIQNIHIYNSFDSKHFRNEKINEKRREKNAELKTNKIDQLNLCHCIAMRNQWFPYASVFSPHKNMLYTFFWFEMHSNLHSILWQSCNRMLLAVVFL